VSRRLLRAGALAAAAIVLALGSAAPSFGDPGGETDERLRIQELRVLGGEEAWHPTPEFRVSWDPPGGGTAHPAVLAIDYLVEDAAGEVVVPVTRIADGGNAIGPVEVPPLAGEYVLSVWLEGVAGAGPPARATLRFDDTRPAPVQPIAPRGWLKAGEGVSVRIEHPAAPWPLSGIRGYAVAVDRGSAEPPCAQADFCAEPEVDLAGGAEDDWISLGPLAEGTSFARVVAVSGSGMRSGSVGNVELRADGSPPAVHLAPLPDGWSDGPVSVRATASDAESGMEPADDSMAATAIAVDGRTQALAPGDTALATVHSEGVHVVDASARDAVGNATWEDDDETPASALVRIDQTVPRVAFAASQDPAEPERIEALVPDLLSGPSASRGSIAVRPAGSRQPFTPIPTEVSTGRLVALWESDAYPAGLYEFRATGYDAAGNRATTEEREGGGRMELRSPLKRPTRIALGFGGARLTAQRCRRVRGRVRCRRRQIVPLDRRPAQDRVRFGRAVPMTGKLEAADGESLADMPVTVIEEFDAGADTGPRTTTVETRDDGSFLARLPRGPSRLVRVAFAGDRLRSRAGSRMLRLAVAATVTLRASAATATVGGAPVLFSGSVAPAGPGHPVELQFRVAGQPWSEFRTVETDAHGRFRYAYSFSDDDSRGVRFQFRARAPRQAGWPYATGASLPVVVTGH
jgi:hypothetical protein